jgi:uncharacterized protein YbjT (DUF2867 family)
MASYCVLGGTGFVGSRLVARLARRGHEVTVPTRRPTGAGDLAALPTVRVVPADVHRGPVLARVLRGADAVVNLVGILNERGRDGSGFRAAHTDLARTLVEACGTAGVRRLVQVSALNAGHPDATSHYLRSKGEAEAVIRGSGLDWTILQPSVIFGPGDSFLNRFAALLRLAPGIMPLPMASARFAPIHVDDVAEAIARVLADPGTAGQTCQLCGPETWSLGEIVTLVARTLGLRRWILPLPPGVARWQAAVMDFVPGKPFSTDNFRSLLLPSVCTEDGCGRLGISPRSLSRNVRQALEAVGLPDPMAPHRQRAGR